MLKNKIKALKNKKGFTLIELIVVIAVLGILVLLAAPRFLGYTADANVAAMKADAKVLENAALVWSVDQEANDGAPGAMPFLNDTAVTVDMGTTNTADDKVGYAIDASKLQIKNLKGDVADYVLTADGEVFHKTGVKDKDGDKHYGVSAETKKDDLK